MPAMINQMFFVDEVPWHGLGHAFEKAPNVDEAIVAAGLDFKVGLKPLFTEEGTKVNRMATFRKDTGDILGTVGMRYRPLQNEDAFKFFQPFLDSGEAELHTAGLLAENRVWILCKLNRDNIVVAKDDEVAKYLMLSHSHDGSLAIRVGFTPIRIVCANTLAMAHASDASKLLSLKHTQKAVESLEKIRNAMNLANQTFEATAEQYRALAMADISSKDLKKYVKLIIGKDGVKDKDLSTRSKNIITDITGRFESGMGNDIKAIRGTYWAAYNSVTEWLSYSRGAKSDSRINQLWFGSSANTNDYALKLALEMAAA